LTSTCDAAQSVHLKAGPASKWTTAPLPPPDRRDDAGHRFIFGIAMHPKLARLAEALIQQVPKYEILTERRPKAFCYKGEVVVEREFKNQKLAGEALAELEYQPTKCHRKYQVIILQACDWGGGNPRGIPDWDWFHFVVQTAIPEDNPRSRKKANWDPNFQLLFERIRIL
jgi:hypothetical protein